jgi:oligopeptidase B
MSTPNPPPQPAKRPVRSEHFGHELVDEYAWLRDRENPDVISHLEAENAYCEANLRPLEALKDRLYAEMLSRIQETDKSAPYPKGPYRYFHRTQEGSSYHVYCRTLGEAGAEQVLLDENALAEGKPYYATGAKKVSPDHRLLAVASDTTGSETYTLTIRAMDGTGTADVLDGVKTSVAWSSDSKSVYYTTADKIDRPYRLHRHVLGTPQSSDVVVYEEPDESYYLYASRSLDGGFVAIALHSKVTTEVHLIDAADPDGRPACVAKRDLNHEYEVQTRGQELWILSNAGANNFQVLRGRIGAPRETWEVVVPHDPEVMREEMLVLANHLVVLERAQGLRRLRVRDLVDGSEHLVAFDETAFGLRLGMNAESDTATLRFNYSSMIMPWSTYDYDLVKRTRVLRKRQPVPGYDPEEFRTYRLEITSHDGVKVPVSLAAHKDVKPDGSNPLVLWGYGAYGSNYDPEFSSLKVSLMSRGVVVGIAHVRGGGDLGRTWYETGKFLHKKNTFEDFVAVGQGLVDQGWAAPERMACFGGSAGGLLVGASMNLRPGLFHAAVAQVPFVDSLNTMLDASLPLTVLEWDEWGNPKEEKFFHYMASYAPYGNVAKVAYPHILATGGLNDPRVGFWEPAKWVARLRDKKIDDRPVLLKMQLEAGHGGPSGRYAMIAEVALHYAFLLDRLGAVK